MRRCINSIMLYKSKLGDVSDVEIEWQTSSNDVSKTSANHLSFGHSYDVKKEEAITEFVGIGSKFMNIRVDQYTMAISKFLRLCMYNASRCKTQSK